MFGDRDRMPSKGSEESEVFEVEARRAFLRNCGKYAVAMPPAIYLLLSAKDASAVPASDSPACLPPGSSGEKNPNCPGFDPNATEGPTDPEINAQ